MMTAPARLLIQARPQNRAVRQKSPGAAFPSRVAGSTTLASVNRTAWERDHEEETRGEAEALEQPLGSRCRDACPQQDREQGSDCDEGSAKESQHHDQ